MPITPDVPKQDLEKVLGQFQTICPGSEQDRAAQLVLLTLGVLQRRLGNPLLIKMVFLENPQARGIIPEAAYNVASQYVNGQMTQEEASQTLTEALSQYKKIFQEAGIKPARSYALFG